ncbi:hypothetical protein NLG97_g1963 [Lecanicillium saksenae]|uniref:Uncharacterized protein n=1 Tax=Lecanicillium saksenae TaxID=468837 RepID=A0ACC1R2G6_9HYPO|nr:hypothetical protein NLG97_g1963 [Lecanicillium saksenae]
MDASYDGILFQVDVPVRVFAATYNDLRSVVYFDFFGKPAQINIPAAIQVNKSPVYELFRGRLHSLSRALASKSIFYTASKFTFFAMQIENILKDFMLDIPPPPPPLADIHGRFPLESFFCMDLLQFTLTEGRAGNTCVIQETSWLELVPATDYSSQIPRGLPSISSIPLRVVPIRCGVNRISGSIILEMGHHVAQVGPKTYTYVCLRNIGGGFLSEADQRAFAFQLRKLKLIERAYRALIFEESRSICIPIIQTYIYHEFGGRAPALPVGAMFDEMPGLVPLRCMTPPWETLRKWVLQICKTVEWLIEKKIGWGGSFAYMDSRKGQALLDAVVVDAFGKPWLIEGFTDSRNWGLVNDQTSVQMLRSEFSLIGPLSKMAEDLYIHGGKIVGNHVEIVFELKAEIFCLSVPPVRKNTKPFNFSQTCNSLVEAVLMSASFSSYFAENGEAKIRHLLLRIPKHELLQSHPGPSEARHYSCVKYYFHHGLRRCELHPGDDGKALFQLCRNVALDDVQANDLDDQNFANMLLTADIPTVPAGEIFITPSTMISATRIHGEVRGQNDLVYHCIAARNVSYQGARRWNCPERRQIIARQQLQLACAANPSEGCNIHVPDLLAYFYDDNLGRDLLAQQACIMGGLLWGGEYGPAEDARLLIDSLVIDRQGDPWLVDGFGTTYHEDVVQNDKIALLLLYDAMRLESMEPTDVSEEEDGASTPDCAPPSFDSGE